MSGGLSSTVETVNAAATAIMTANSRVQQVTSPRRRWGGCFSIYWCFGSQRHDKRVSNSSFTPEVMVSGPGHIAPEIPIQLPAPAPPVVAPPSSPASGLLSDPSSAAPSPGGLFSLTAVSAGEYSPGGPASIFAIGPYANDTQLVSPPVFSTFTTEPSTAPLTPPEPVHLTTPSSPEVPFAELLMSSLDSTLKKSEGHGFQSYQWYPGSPIGNLISPSSVCSSTSSPYPDADFRSTVNGSSSSFPIADPPMLVTAEGLAIRKKIPLQSSRGDGLLVGDCDPAAELPKDMTTSSSQDADPLLSQRVSFELSNKEETGEKSEASEKAVTELHSAESASEANNMADEPGKILRNIVDESYHDLPSNDQAMKEFKFENVDGAPDHAIVRSNWWANEDASRKETAASKNWSFFPVKQPSVT